MPVGGDADADASPAYEDTAKRPAFTEGGREPSRHVGIVHGAAIVRAEVQHLQAALADLPSQAVLELEAGMVCGECDGVGMHRAASGAALRGYTIDFRADRGNRSETGNWRLPAAYGRPSRTPISGSKWPIDQGALAMPKVTMSTPVAMNADALWQSIGSFAAIGHWHPMMERVDTDGETKGSLRTLRLIGGAKLVERLEEVSPTERLYRYSILESPLPISDYFAEIRVKDNGDGTSTVEWSSDFKVNSNSERDVVKTVQEVYQAGLDNLGKLYGFGR